VVSFTYNISGPGSEIHFLADWDESTAGMSSTEIAATDWEKYVLSLQKICKTTPFAMQQCVVMNSGIRYLHVS